LAPNTATPAADNASQYSDINKDPALYPHDTVIDSSVTSASATADSNVNKTTTAADSRELTTDNSATTS
jgi:hypothetical protein